MEQAVKHYQGNRYELIFVTKAAYDDLGMSDLQYRSTADYDFMLRFWEIQESCVFISNACVI
ncbi:MAG: hypothetical protein K2G55_18785 [Lachnospiraceae bacterium]|nr:hypothetical protein [Lachnospiraceae bacterium]MDE7202398.1 hypothetical protein [Lachnospiraceae bacterium]